MEYLFLIVCFLIPASIKNLRRKTNKHTESTWHDISAKVRQNVWLNVVEALACVNLIKD